MQKFWCPEDNSIRFPKPKGMESYPVDEDFVAHAGKVETDKDGEKFASQDSEKLAEVESEKQDKISKGEERALAFSKIDEIKDIEQVKEILKYLAGVK